MTGSTRRHLTTVDQKLIRKKLFIPKLNIHLTSAVGPTWMSPLPLSLSPLITVTGESHCNVRSGPTRHPCGVKQSSLGFRILPCNVRPSHRKVGYLSLRLLILVC
ncbi:hypothetical protein MRB53_014884 [Persea americana]|uniref:Uncharacterized protein n=1 Tax=Persea americana TaxID=3435 RepID=A0ACC2KC23_PERAE|nr:hypothetical protein MRB53_014884 [Persea americana]